MTHAAERVHSPLDRTVSRSLGAAGTLESLTRDNTAPYNPEDER